LITRSNIFLRERCVLNFRVNLCRNTFIFIIVGTRSLPTFQKQGFVLNVSKLVMLVNPAKENLVVFIAVKTNTILMKLAPIRMLLTTVLIAEDHLATSLLCPEVIKHKMILSMASTNNIPFSEAKKSVYSQSQNSPSFRFTDPRFDFQNFPHISSPRSNPSPPSLNKFSILQNYANNSPRFSPPDSHRRLEEIATQLVIIITNTSSLNTRIKRSPLMVTLLLTVQLNPLPVLNIIPTHRILPLAIIMIY